ncbi:MAG: CBS domain-containing protein [Erysipelotrichaceae bacterium]|nr:CBS domain-containing protein [Erysipelotrichaceae bacterium]
MLDSVFFFLKPKEEVSFFFSNLSVQDGLEFLKSHTYTIMPVISPEGEYLGSISEGDFLWYTQQHPSPYRDSIASLIRKDFIPPCDINVDLSTLFEQSLKQNYVPIVDDRNIFIGIVTRQAILSYLLDHVQLSQE